MKTHRIGIIMNGVTGRMGTNQHLIRSIKAIIDQGGVKLSDGEVILPDPVLVGRNEDKLRALAARAGVTRVFMCVAPRHETAFTFPKRLSST